MNKSLLICDLDGTLIDSREDLTDAVNRARADFGLAPLSLPSVVSYVGDGARKLIVRAFSDTPGADIEAALASMKRHYAAGLVVKTTLYDGVREGLAALHAAGHPLAVISNKPGRFCEEILSLFGLAELFQVVMGGDIACPLKPAPDSLLLALARTGAEAGQSWIVGDNYTDLESGRRAGVKRCYAAYGFGDPKSEEADLRVDSFTMFVKAIIPGGS